MQQSTNPSSNTGYKMAIEEKIIVLDFKVALSKLLIIFFANISDIYQRII